jgi:hypothetical protein
MKRILLLSIIATLLIGIFFFLAPQGHIYAQTIVSPTNYCLGSCPTTVPSGTSPSTGPLSPQPSSSAPLVPSPSSTVEPCAEQASYGVFTSQKKKGGQSKKHKPRDGGNGLFIKLLQFLIEFINRLLQLLGGGQMPVPNQPNPGDGGNEPCPPDDGDGGDDEPQPSIPVPSGTVPSTTVPSNAPSGPVPSGSTGTNPSGEAMPKGDVSGWKQIFADDFTTNVPLGAFSNCNNNTDTPQANCTGLKNYGSYYENWWAYPKGWADTAKSGADGNTGAPYGGIYSPEETVFVDNGAMHVKMFRPANGGDNRVAAVVPRKCMDTQYGRYVERFKVVRADPGFKSAHLFYGNGLEIDYPENDYNRTISAFTHPGEDNFQTNAKWTEWHTTAIERTKGQVKYYMDGKLIGTATRSIPDIKLSWILQNESSIEGPYAQNGAIAQIDFDWVTCYAPAN